MEPKLLGNRFLAKQLVGLAKLQLEILRRHMRLHNLPQDGRMVKGIDGSWIKVTRSFGLENISIYVPPRALEVLPATVEEYVKKIFAGFLCHPRTFGGKGWDSKGNELVSGPFTYPLVDDDHGSRGLQWKDDWKIVKKPPENYGNVDWLCGDTVLTWKGPPSRHFSLDPTLNIPGLTVFDEEVGEIEYYTLFTPNIYRGGKVYAVAPQKVLGAAIYDKMLIAVLGANYRGKTNPEEGNGGFYFEAWLRQGGGSDLFSDDTPRGWRRLAFKRGGRPTQPFFFSNTGLNASAVQSGVLYRLTVSDAFKSAEFTTDDTGFGTIAESKTVSDTNLDTFPGEIAPDIFSTITTSSEDAKWDGAITGSRGTNRTTVNRSGNLVLAADFPVSIEQSVIMHRTSADVTIIESILKQTYQLIPNIPYDAPGGLSATVFYAVPDGGIRVNDSVGVSGGCPPYEFSFSNGDITNYGLITSVSGCSGPGSPSMGTVTVTDSDGRSTSVEVRLPNGSWYTESGEGARGSWWDNYITYSPFPSQMNDFTPVIQGNIKYTGAYFGRYCRTGCSGTLCSGETCQLACIGMPYNANSIGCGDSWFGTYPTSVGPLHAPMDSNFGDAEITWPNCSGQSGYRTVICGYKVTNRIGYWRRYEWRCP